MARRSRNRRVAAGQASRQNFAISIEGARFQIAPFLALACNAQAGLESGFISLLTTNNTAAKAAVAAER